MTLKEIQNIWRMQFTEDKSNYEGKKQGTEFAESNYVLDYLRYKGCEVEVIGQFVFDALELEMTDEMKRNYAITPAEFDKKVQDWLDYNKSFDRAEILWFIDSERRYNNQLEECNSVSEKIYFN